jgi:hypothetical protein
VTFFRCKNSETSDKHLSTFHILDDFLILAPTFDMCKRYLEEFLTICDKIGIPMAPEKTMGPCTCLTFLGIELNTVQKVARLPNDKVDRCLSLKIIQNNKHHTIWHKHLSHIVKACTKSFKNLTGR